jgi:predicted nucleic acid-binding protein
MFGTRILPLDEEVLLKWRLLVEEGRKTGFNYSQPDLLIAATALHHGLIVATRNTRDFERAGVPVVNPWP